MKAGAVEFLTKPCGDEVLLRAIQQAIEWSQTSLQHEAQMRSIRECYASLTRRERQVMDLVVRGLLNRHIGDELDISEVTVKAHRGNVMRKMNADSLADLVNMATRLHLASAPNGWHFTNQPAAVSPEAPRLLPYPLSGWLPETRTLVSTILALPSPPSPACNSTVRCRTDRCTKGAYSGPQDSRIRNL